MTFLPTCLRTKKRTCVAYVVLVFIAIYSTGVIACEPLTFTVAVDVGHTTRTPGATSARGVPEFEFNRILANKIVSTLKEDGFAKTYLINGDGRIDSLIERCHQAENGGADLFLSIHHDSVQPHYLKTWTVRGKPAYYCDQFSGYSLFVSSKNQQFAQSQHAAFEIGKALHSRGLTPTLHHAEQIKGENRTLLNTIFGIYLFDDLIVLKRSSVPAVLLEAGIIINRNDELTLSDLGSQQLFADSISAAVTALCHQEQDEEVGNLKMSSMGKGQIGF